MLGEVPLPVNKEVAHEGLRTVYTSTLCHLLLLRSSALSVCSLLLEVEAAILSNYEDY